MPKKTLENQDKKYKRAIPKFLTKEEITDILDKAKKKRYRDYILLLCLWRTGIRTSELTSLKKEDIVEDTLIIRAAKSQAGSRTIPLEREVLGILRTYTDQMKARDKIFPITPRQVGYVIHKYGPENVHPHTFRHSFAVHCLKQGINLRSLQKLLGHSQLNTTQVYLDIVGKDVKEDFEKVNWD